MCLLEPMPPNAVPASRPTSATATVPISNTDTTTNRSSGTLVNVTVPSSGVSAQTSRLETISTVGPATDTQPVPAA